MKLMSVIANYVAFKRSLGMRFRSQAVALKTFCHSMGELDIAEVNHRSALSYIAGSGPLTVSWHKKFEVLSGFYRFAITRGYVNSSPLPTTIPKRPPSLLPYIYTNEQMRQLLESTNILEKPRQKIRAMAFRTLLLLLYGTGLRISEALSLTLSEVDLSENLITVNNSKFFKSRLVPIGLRLSAVLCTYVRERRRFPCPAREDSAFFATCKGTSLNCGSVERIFRMLCIQSGIHREDGGRYQPRLHDIRHTFAVNRLVSWYRAGADVQRLLPQLSTYLGHVNIGDTQRYLTMTPELLQEANRRFERYILTEVQHV